MRSAAGITAVVVVTAVLFTPTALGGEKKPALEPGKYKVWGPDIDEIEIVKKFKAADYGRVVVLDADTTATPLPPKSEKSFDSVNGVLAGYTDTLVEALRDEFKTAKVERAATAPADEKTLILRSKVDELTPGSRAGRMLVGMGAGSTSTKLSGEIVDARSGEVLVRFTQKRRSAGTFKFAGGNDMQIMRDSIHAIAQDIAHIIQAFE